MTKAHEQTETLTVDVFVPEHADRVTTPLFRKTREALLKISPRCYICGRTHEEAGPLEAHHYPVERCFAEGVDWERFQEQAKLGHYGPGPQNFDWRQFSPDKPYDFVDNMMNNGLVLCKEHHIGKDAGIHAMPHANWIAQKYLKEGYQFSPTEIIHHEGDE